MSLRPSIRCALLAAACCAVATDAAAEDRAKPRKPGHPVVLWTWDEDYAAPGFLDAARALGATAVQAAPDRDVRPLLDAGMWWYEDEASGKGTLALREAEWKPAWEEAWETRRDTWPSEDVRRRPRCLRERKWIDDMAGRVRLAARRAKDGNALWIALADEPSMTVRANPGDWCLCGTCTRTFRNEVRESYRDLQKLNRAWGTEFADWDVMPFTTAAMRARELGKSAGSWNLAPWLATRVFQDRAFATSVARLGDASREEAPDVPVGLAGMQAPSAFGGFDYALLMPAMTFVEPYDIGLALPIARDLAERKTIVAQTVFPSDDVRVSRLRMWRGIARGANAAIVWSSRDALKRTDAGFVRTPYADAICADLRLLSTPDGVGERLAASKAFDEGIEIVLSQRAVQEAWMKDSAEDGDTWPKRFGSYEASHSTAIRNRETAWTALADRGKRFVSERSRLGPYEALANSPAGRVDPRVRVDPERLSGSLREDAEKACGPPQLRATASRKSGGAPVVEVGLSTHADGTRYAVCVPMWDLATGDDGAATGAIPRGELTITWSFGDGKPRAVRDELLGKDVGVAVSWKTVGDAAEPHVWSWKP